MILVTSLCVSFVFVCECMLFHLFLLIRSVLVDVAYT